MQLELSVVWCSNIRRRAKKLIPANKFVNTDRSTIGLSPHEADLAASEIGKIQVKRPKFGGLAGCGRYLAQRTKSD